MESYLFIFPMTLLVFLPAAAVAQVVAIDFLFNTNGF